MPMNTKNHTPSKENIVWHHGAVSSALRGGLLNQRGCVLWFTGLSGSGKSTIACALEAALIARGHLAYVLDGDNIRHGLNGDLTFTPEDRHENLRRIGEVAALFADAGVITICAFISPYRADRDQARRIAEQHCQAPFLEVYIDTPLAVCEARDPKGLYRKARAGQISGFTGISAPYEPPLDPELAIATRDAPLAACTERLLDFLNQQKLCPAGE